MIWVWLEAFALVPLSEHAIFSTIAWNLTTDVCEWGHYRSRLTHLCETSLADVNWGVEALGSFFSRISSDVGPSHARRFHFTGTSLLHDCFGAKAVPTYKSSIRSRIYIIWLLWIISRIVLKGKLAVRVGNNMTNSHVQFAIFAWSPSFYKFDEDSFEACCDTLSVQAADGAKRSQGDGAERTLESNWSFWEWRDIVCVLFILEMATSDEVQMRHEHKTIWFLFIGILLTFKLTSQGQIYCSAAGALALKELGHGRPDSLHLTQSLLDTALRCRFQRIRGIACRLLLFFCNWRPHLFRCRLSTS